MTIMSLTLLLAIVSVACSDREVEHRAPNRVEPPGRVEPKAYEHQHLEFHLMSSIKRKLLQHVTLATKNTC